MHAKTVPCLFAFVCLPNLAALANDNTRRHIGADVVQSPPISLSGQGVPVMVYDIGSADPTHPDFGGRIVNRYVCPLRHNPCGGLPWGGAVRDTAPEPVV